MMPTSVPIVVVSSTTISAMVSEMRDPMMPRDRISRPNLSVPRKWNGAAVGRAEEMDVGRDEPEQLVAVALHEEAKRGRVGLVGTGQRLEGHRIELPVELDDRVDIGQQR